MAKWAKCSECGGEVVFDAWAHLNEEVYSTFDNNTCTECRCNDVDFTEEEIEEEIDEGAAVAHTPGPWHCHFLGQIEELDDGGGLATGITTASIDEFNKEGDRGDLIAWVPHDRNEEANANLIASAPELLAALKQCREALLHICHNSAFADDAPEFNEGGIGYEACSVSIVAINKAEGRS